MKNLYKIIILLIVFFVFQGAYAQKTLKMQVTNVNTNKNTDCDGALNDSDFEWRWFNGGSDLGCAYFGGNNGPIGDNTVRDLYSGSYWSADCWGNGIGVGGASMTITLRVSENDELVGSCNSGDYCTRTDGTTVPAYNSATGNTTFANNTGVDCDKGCDAPYGSAAHLNYKHTLRWEVAGSYSGINLDANAYVTNKTCATAIALGTNTNGTLRSNDVTQCTDTWYSYINTANVTAIKFDPSQNSSNVEVYYAPTNSCGSMCLVASGGGEATLRGPKNTGTYYIRLTASGGGNTNLVITRTGSGSNDNFSQATNVGAPLTAGATYNGSFNNNSYSDETGEPHAESGYNTAWYTFTTPPEGLNSVTASISENGGNNSFVGIYKKTADGCAFPTLSKITSDRWCAASGGNVNTTCLDGNTTYYVQYGTANNFAVCIGGENTGGYNVSIAAGGTPSGKDNVCDAYDFGTLNAGSSTATVYYNNNCMTIQPSEPRTGNMSNTMWYKFKTPANGLVSVNIDANEAGEGANYTAVALYKKTGACSGVSGLAEVGFERWCNADGGTLTVNCLEGGVDYYVQLGTGYNFDLCSNILNGGRSAGRYSLRVSASSNVAAPDNVCSAVQVGTGTIGVNQSATTTTYTNLCSTVNTGGYADPVNAEGNDATDWFYFTTPATPAAQYYFKFNNMGDFGTWGGLEGEVYKKTGGTCPPTLSYVGSWDPAACGVEEESGGFCLDPSSTYYIMVDAEQDGVCGGRGKYQLSVRGSNSTAAPDNVCSADDLGTFATYTGANLTFTRTNHSNECAGTQANEPSGGQKTTWYKFTTGSVVGRELYVLVNAKSNSFDAEVSIYEVCSPPICTGATLNANKLNEIANYWNGLMVPALGIGEWNAEGTLSGVILPNTTYYVRVDGVAAFTTSGEYDLTVRMQGGFYNGNDDICNAWTVGASNSPGGSGATHTESISNNDILDLGETITVPVFDNKRASAQEACALDEPNMDENDESVWFKVTTGSNPGTEITVDVDAINDGSGGLDCIGGLSYGWVKAYKVTNPALPLPVNCAGWTTNTNWFSLLSPAGKDDLIDASKYYITCPLPNTTYYIQIENQALGCDKSSFTMTVKDNGFQAGPDKICDALDLGQAVYGGPLSNTTNIDLFIDKQSNYCATVSPNEPDAFPAQSVDKSVWYKFTTPPAYYPTSPELAQLPHVYTFEVNRLGGGTLAWPTFAVWEQTSATTRVCTPENVASFSNLALVDYTQNLDFGNASLEYLCLKPSTTYYVQIDHATAKIGDDYVEFSLRVKKAAFRAADNLCDAFDLGIITSDGTPSGTPNNVTWTNSGKLSAAPIFGLPHTNKCTSAENGENGVSPGGPSPIGGGGNHTATTWYKFTTGATVPEWIYWYNDDRTGGDGNRGSVCTGLLFNSEVTFLTPETPTPSCPVQTQMVAEHEMNIPGDVCEATTGIGFGAPCYKDLFRLKCPRPNTTYYVQIKDAGAISPCYEGIWTYDNTNKLIKTSPTTGGAPTNDSICYAINLGTVPNGGTLAPGTIFDNFCATPDKQWRADFTQPLDADVWFKFKPPLSGSVLITAQSAPPGSPSIDDDLDLQIAIWEPILGDGTNTHCSDPRYLWTPIIAQDHGLQESVEAGVITTTYYDIYKTCGNSILCNEGNSLIATCLDPNKYYYIQVDGGDYFGCDLIDAGDCVMGYFKLQIQDANLGLLNSSNLAQNVSPYTAPAVRNYEYLHDEPCFAQPLLMSPKAGPISWTTMTNRCATSIGDPVPAVWAARNSSTDKTVWAYFIAPPSGKVKIRAENIAQVKGDADYHEQINLQLALYQTSNCFDKWRLQEVGNGNGFDGGLVEIDPLNNDDYVSVCVPGVNGCGFDEYMVSRCLNPGQTYYIMIDGDAGYVAGADVEDIEGDFRISVQEIGTIVASTNDKICDAYDMESGGIKPSTLATNAAYTTPIAFNNECATIDTAYEGNSRIAHNIAGTLFNFDVEHTLWFKFKAPSSGKVKIEALNDGSIDPIDLGLSIFDIPSQNCNHIQSQGYKFDQDYDPAVFGIANTQDEEITVTCLTPNKWYWIQVDGNRNPTICGPLASGTDCKTGQFKLKITHLPSDPTYADQVDYTPNPDLAGGNDNYCDAHRVRGASGTINIFNNATYLQNGETITFRHNNRCATTEVNEPELNGWNLNPFNSGNTPTVWYVFNTGPILPPLLPGEITINVTNPSGVCFDPDTDLYEYTGSLNSYYTAAGCQNLGTNKFNRLFRVGEGTNIPYLPALRPERITLSCPKPMTTYLLRIAGSSNCPLFGDNMGDFDVSISMSAIPGLDVFNNDICNADDLGIIASGGSKIKGSNNFCATQQQNEPNTSQDCVQSEPCADETVWFKFKTSATPGEIEVVVKDVLALGAIAAPSIAIYRYVGADNSCTANPFSNLAKLDENSGVVVLAGVQLDSAKVHIPCARPDATYYVQVDGIDMAILGFTLPYSTDNFAFNLQVRDLGNYTGRAPNDDLAKAIPIDSTITRPNAYVLPAGGTKSIKGHNRCATCEQGEIGNNCGLDETGHTAMFGAEDETVWYYFTTPSTPGKITITVADDPAIAGTFSPNFRLYYYNKSMGTPQYRITNAPSRKIIQEGGNPSGISAASETYTCLLPNTEYYIQIDGNDNVPFTVDQGQFILTVSDDNSGNPGPTNDLICNAEQLSTNMVAKVNRTNKCSWEETGEPNTSNNMGGTGDDVTSNDYDETVWFTFVPTVEQSIRLQLDVTSGMLGGLNYVLYEMPSTTTITCTGTPADIPTWTQLKEMARGSSTLLVGNEIDETWPCLKPTKRYYLQIDGNDMPAADDVGSFDIQLTASNQTTPLNDDICGIGAVPGAFPATSTTGNFGSFTTSATRAFNNQNNVCATQQVGEPETNGPINDITDPGYDHTLWYKFVASATDGTYQIKVTNNVGIDPINAYIGLFRQNNDAIPVCSSTTWNRISKIKETSSIKVTNDVTLDVECWEIEEGRTYYFQVQGIDGLLGGDVGNNFNVSVQFTAGITNPADNICTAPTAIIGTTYDADNQCATTEPNEPNVSPMPQSPLDGKSYDETLWYKFVAPPSGEVKLTLSNFSVPLLLSVNVNMYEIPEGYNCALNGFNGLIRNESSGFLTSGLGSTEFRCLSPGKTYYIQFDGNDALTDRGTWKFILTDIFAANNPPPNDEPCTATDVTQHIRGVALGPCTTDGQYYTNNYSVNNSPRVDQATKTANAIGCNGELNCNDYWFKFTVPLDATGVRIQGNDEYGLAGANNSKQVIGIYRAPSGCGGPLQQINCSIGGFNNDVDMTVGAFPGETLYLQVFDATPVVDPARPTFGFCLSVDCPPKTPCGANTLTYDGPQCWNMNTNGTTVSPLYYNCIAETIKATNYFTFATDCDGTPVDTVSLVFSVTNMGCGRTAMSLMKDNSLCDGTYDEMLVNCAVFEEVLGGTTATNFFQTYILPGCTNYVVQIISNKNDASCAAGGQILILKTNTPPTTALPIELLSFTGYNEGIVNVLSWTTASERNSLKFEIEKSYDANSFEKIGEVAAAGNSYIDLNYTFNDNYPQIGNNYYRLKMIDIDGTFKYSEIINIRVREDNLPITDGIVKIYPNPTNGYLNIQYQSSRDNELKLQVFDAIGQQMLNKAEKVNRGMNIIQINAMQFANGIYILNLIDDEHQERHQAKFVKE